MSEIAGFEKIKMSESQPSLGAAFIKDKIWGVEKMRKTGAFYAT